MRTRIISLAALAVLAVFAPLAPIARAQEEASAVPAAPAAEAAAVEAAAPAPELEQTEAPATPDLKGNGLAEAVNREAEKMNAVRAEIRSEQNRDESAVVIAPGSYSLKNFLKLLGAFLLVLALIVCLGYLVRLTSRFAPRLLGGRSALLGGARLGRVMGRIYLDPRASLHFIETGGRVLVVGVTQSHITLVSEFDAAAYGVEAAEKAGPDAATETRPAIRGASPPPKSAAAAADASRFLSVLMGRGRRSSARKPEARPAQEDADITALRGDIKRLQQYLKDTSGGDANT